jgi:hypothetical protein
MAGHYASSQNHLKKTVFDKKNLGIVLTYSKHFCRVPPRSPMRKMAHLASTQRGLGV